MIIQIPYLLKNPEKPVAAADDELFAEASNDINKNFIFSLRVGFPFNRNLRIRARGCLALICFAMRYARSPGIVLLCLAPRSVLCGMRFFGICDLLFCFNNILWRLF